METLFPLIAAPITLIDLAWGEAATRRPASRLVHAIGAVTSPGRSQTMMTAASPSSARHLLHPRPSLRCGFPPPPRRW